MKTLREYMNQEQIAIYEELKKTPYNFYTNLDKTVFDNCRDMVDIIEKQERIKNVKEEFFSYDSKLKQIQELEEKLERAKKEIELIDKLEQAGIENVYQSMLRDRADEVKDNTDYYLEITKTNKPAVIHFMVYLKDNQGNDVALRGFDCFSWKNKSEARMRETLKRFTNEYKSFKVKDVDNVLTNSLKGIYDIID